jgi:HTH-type transcriptional regulator / antitoxin HipB
MEKVIRSPNDIGPLIKAIRKKNDLTQTQLSKLTRVKQQNISAIENGKQQANMKTLFSILSTLNLELLVQPRVQRRGGFAPGCDIK